MIFSSISDHNITTVLLRVVQYIFIAAMFSTVMKIFVYNYIIIRKMFLCGIWLEEIWKRVKEEKKEHNKINTLGRDQLENTCKGDK